MNQLREGVNSPPALKERRRIIIASKISDTERLERIKKVFPNEVEARDIFTYDKAVEADEITPYDLPPEKEKIAKKFTHTGTRKAPTAYKFTTRQRKPNATKEGIITELAEFMENNSNFAVTDLIVTNKERQVAFKIGDDNFELTLVQKRRKKS